MKNREYVFGDYKIYCEKNCNASFFLKAKAGIVIVSLRTRGHLGREKQTHVLVTASHVKCR